MWYVVKFWLNFGPCWETSVNMANLVQSFQNLGQNYSRYPKYEYSIHQGQSFYSHLNFLNQSNILQNKCLLAQSNYWWREQSTQAHKALNDECEWKQTWSQRNEYGIFVNTHGSEHDRESRCRSCSRSLHIVNGWSCALINGFTVRLKKLDMPYKGADGQDLTRSQGRHC